MGKFAELFAKYRPVGVQPSRELRLRREDGLAMLEECYQQGIVILGLDFCWEQDGAIVEAIGGLSFRQAARGPDPVNQTYLAAKEVLGKELPYGTTLVSFVLKE